MNVDIPYTPRDAFVEFHQRDQPIATMCVHRRAGKTVACVADLAIRGIYTKKPRAQYAYIGPYRAQAKKIAWEYLKDMTKNIRKGNPRESDLMVTLINGSTITIFGADNPDSLLGLYFDGMVVDEYGSCRPNLWGQYLMPTLLDRQGWVVFIGTMRGKNHFYKKLEEAKVDPEAYHLLLKASESGILGPEALAKARSQQSAEEYRQEFECDPNAAVRGTYYTDIIGKSEEMARIGSFPYDPAEMVHVSADLGFTDSTAFWFWQLDAEGPKIIDYEEHDGETVEFYINLLKEKPYEYADVWLPHDAKAKSFQTGRSTVEQLINAGLPCKVVPKLAVQHGIDAARLIMPQVRFHKESCYNGIEALRAYRRQFNDKTQQYANTPLHDWSSNGADAFRYFALVTKTEQTLIVKDEAKEPLLKAPEYTLNDLWKDREKDDWRSRVIRL